MREETTISQPEIAEREVLKIADEDFEPGNVCIVTGAGAGIGRALAVAAAVNNLTVVGLDRDENGGAETGRIVQAFGRDFHFIAADLTVDDHLKTAVDAAAELGRIRYLANIAGIQHVDSIPDFPMDVYDHMQRLMVRAPLYLSKLVMPHMRAHGDAGGVIGNMSSIHGHICTLNKVAYNVAKFGMRGLTQSIAAEGDGRIRSFSVSTGYVSTALTLKQIPAQAVQRGIGQAEVIEEVMLGRSRVKRLMNPVEVANLFIFGFSRFAAHLVGGDLLFDGGTVLTY